MFIGSDYNWDTLKTRLDACLVPDAGIESVDDLPSFADPLPEWKVA